MRSFTFLAASPAGAVGAVTAPGETMQRAAAHLASQGWTILGEAEATESAKRLSLKRRLRLNAATLAQDLGMLVSSGMTATDSLRLLATRERSHQAREVVLRTVARLEEGETLSAAMATEPLSFPPLLVATVAASELTGDLATGLARYAEHQRGFQALRDRVVSACVYPLLLLVLGFGILAFLLLVIVPRFSRLLDSTSGELPFLSAMLLAWGHAIDTTPWLLALGSTFAIALPVAIVMVLRNAAMRSALMAKLPVVGRVAREFQHLQMYRSLGLLAAGGIPIVNALGLVASLLTPADQLRLAGAKAAIERGASISSAFDQSELADLVAVAMLAAADRTGTLSHMLERVGDFYEASLARNIDVASRLIEPVLMIAIGAVIGGLVLLMYLPIFDLASRVG